MFDRRRFFALAAAITGLGTASAGPAASAANAPSGARKHRVAYHISEPGKAGFVLANIRNHIKGVGGPQNVEIVLVAHGPALKAFNVLSGNQKVIGILQKLQREAGVSFRACGNTMRKLGYGPDELPPGTVRVSQGGVVHLMELQEAGYSYLRP